MHSIMSNYHNTQSDKYENTLIVECAKVLVNDDDYRESPHDGSVRKNGTFFVFIYD
jgi:hypothetical protein